MNKPLLFLFLSTLLLSSCENKLAAPDVHEPARSAATNILPTPQEDIEPKAKTFVSKKGRFSINFPEEPKEQVHSSDSEIGKTELVQYIYSPNSTKAWISSYSDYPEKVIRLGNPSQLLKGIKHQVLDGLAAETLNQKEVKFMEKYNGLSFVAHSDRKNLDILYKIYLVDNRVYQLSMYSSVGKWSAQDSTDFLGSFKLLEKGPS